MSPSLPFLQEGLVKMRAAMHAAAKPTATPSEDDGKLDRDDGSGDVITI